MPLLPFVLSVSLLFLSIFDAGSIWKSENTVVKTELCGVQVEISWRDDVLFCLVGCRILRWMERGHRYAFVRTTIVGICWWTSFEIALPIEGCILRMTKVSRRTPPCVVCWERSRDSVCWVDDTAGADGQSTWWCTCKQ